jgi:hypothetical protein
MQTFYVADIYKHAGAFWVYPLDLPVRAYRGAKLEPAIEMLLLFACSAGNTLSFLYPVCKRGRVDRHRTRNEAPQANGRRQCQHRGNVIDGLPLRKFALVHQAPLAPERTG